MVIRSHSFNLTSNVEWQKKQYLFFQWKRYSIEIPCSVFTLYYCIYCLRIILVFYLYNILQCLLNPAVVLFDTFDRDLFEMNSKPRASRCRVRDSSSASFWAVRSKGMFEALPPMSLVYCAGWGIPLYPSVFFCAKLRLVTPQGWFFSLILGRSL